MWSDHRRQPSAQERGSDFEQAVADFYRYHGYDVVTNVRLTGRSGATHEVDVLAEKLDGISTFRVGVECKAWARPIDKDVVAKTAWVFDDLSIGNRVIITTGGATESARLAAAAQNVVIWDQQEFEANLRSAGIRQGPGNPKLYRIPPNVPPRADAQWHQTRRAWVEGRVRRDENLIISSRLWVPHIVLEWHIGIETGIFRKRRSSIKVGQIFEGIGQFAGGRSVMPGEFDRVSRYAHQAELPDAVWPIETQPDDLSAHIHGGLEVLRGGEFDRDYKRMASNLFGIDTDVVSIVGWELSYAQITFLDTYVALVRRGGQPGEYVHAVSADNGAESGSIAAVLSEQTWRLKELPGFGVPALAQPPPPPPPFAPPPAAGRQHESPY